MSGADRPAPPPVDHAALFRQLPVPFMLVDLAWRYVEVNDAYCATVGRSREELLGRVLFDVFPPEELDEDGRSPVQRSFERAVETGRPDHLPVVRYAMADADGALTERYWSAVHVPVRDAEGVVNAVLQRTEDVTEYVREREARRSAAERGDLLQQRVEQVESDLFQRAQELATALAAEERASRRLAGLAEAALLLAGAETVRELTESVIGAGLVALGADGGAIGVREEDTGLLRMTITGSLGERTQVQFDAVPVDGPLPASVAARTGATIVLPTQADGLAWADEMRPVYEATGRRAWASLPLKVGDRLLGSLTASWTEEHAFAPDEVGLLEAFAAQCAQALDRLQVREAEQRAARVAQRLSEALQRSLLTEPPEPDHLQIAVRYQPAAAEAQVGGDWYDAFLLADGSTTLVVGDVAGHDRNAAAAMGQIRNVLRGIAQIVVEPPAAVLSALDRALHNLAFDALATAVLVQVTQTDEQRQAGLRSVGWSNAGHPPPLLLHPDGRAELLSRPPDLLLGLQPDTARTDHLLVLPAGSTLLLYSDGLVERRGEPLDTGLERLRQHAERSADLPAEELLDVLLATLPAEADDDVALLALRLFPEDRPRPREAGPRRLPGGGTVDPR